MSSPSRFIKRLASHQAPREAVVRQCLRTREFLVVLYRAGHALPAFSTTTEADAVRHASDWVAAWREDQPT